MKYFFSVIAIVLLGCVRSSEEPQYITDFSSLRSSYCKEMNEKYGLMCSGYGGSFQESIKEVSVHFHSNQKVSLEEARRIFISGNESLAKRINSSEKLRGSLREYPLPKNAIEIDISFDNQQKQEKPHNKFSWVVKYGDQIYYKYMDPTTYDLTIVYEESYDEALLIVRSEQASPNASQ